LKTFLLVLCTVLTIGVLAGAQEPAQTAPPEVSAALAAELLGSEVPALPSLPELSLKDVIDTLADYDFTHESGKVMNIIEAWGVTDPHTKNIIINDSQSSAGRKKTIIHEFIHTQYYAKSVETGGPFEEQVDAKAKALFKKLYGPEGK
jgi:hypothetical protein